MSWTRSIAPEEATGAVAEAYERARAASSHGAVANLWQAQGLDPAGLAAVQALYREANLPARDRVLCDHAVALTCEPSERTAADLERLREYGFEDAAIVKATMIAGYYNLTNRIASVLGVELETGLEAWRYGAQR